MVFEQVIGMPHAYIPFTPDRQRQLDVINAYLHGLGIYPIGRFGEWKYVNQDGAILSAKRVVESIRSDGKLPAMAARSSTDPREGGSTDCPDSSNGRVGRRPLNGSLTIDPRRGRPTADRMSSSRDAPARRPSTE